MPNGAPEALWVGREAVFLFAALPMSAYGTKQT